MSAQEHLATGSQVKWACASCEKVCRSQDWPEARRALCLDCALLRQAAEDDHVLERALVDREYDTAEVIEALVRRVYYLNRPIK